MRNIIFLIIIVCWWFLLGLTLSYMGNDPYISSSSAGNNTYVSTLDTSNMNVSGGLGEDNSFGGVFSMVRMIFGFSIPSDPLPNGARAIVSFLNWLLVVVAGLLLWRLISPASGE